MTLGFIGAVIIAVAIIAGRSSVGAHLTVRLSPRNATRSAVSCELLGICARFS